MGLSSFSARLTRRRGGQVDLNSQIGQWIKLLAQDPDVKTVVEIGAWNGRGTTACLKLGAESRPDCVRVLSLEAERDLAAKAASFHMNSRVIEIVWGSVIGPEDLDGIDLTEVESNWFHQERNSLQNCPRVLQTIPASIDLLILDGGEFSTYSEWELLQSRVTKWCVLDDISMRKGRRIVDEVSKSAGPWRILMRASERNGTAVLLRL